MTRGDDQIGPGAPLHQAPQDVRRVLEIGIDRAQNLPARHLPAAEMEPSSGNLEDAGQVMVADQFQGIVDPLKKAGCLDFEFADLTAGRAVQIAEYRPAERDASSPSAAARSADRACSTTR